MTQESDLEAGQAPSQRDLIVRSEQTSLAAAAEIPYLQRVGFSPALMDGLSRINDLLVNYRPPLRSVGLELIPGQTPLVTTYVEHGGEGYRVNIDSNGRAATLNIETRAFNPQVGLTLGDVQEFMHAAFPEKEVVMHGFQDDIEEDQEGDFESDLYEVTDDLTRPWIGVSGGKLTTEG